MKKAVKNVNKDAITNLELLLFWANNEIREYKKFIKIIKDKLKLIKK